MVSARNLARSLGSIRIPAAGLGCPVRSGPIRNDVLLVVEFSNLVVSGGTPSLPPTVIEPGGGVGRAAGRGTSIPGAREAAARRDPPGDAGEIQEADGA